MKLSSEPEEAMANETPALAKYAILLKGTLSMGEGTTTIEQKSDSSKFLKVVCVHQLIAWLANPFTRTID